MSLSDKLTVICFDETYISNRICFDKKNERVIGPHKSVQTVIAQGTYNKNDNMMLIIIVCLDI